MRTVGTDCGPRMTRTLRMRRRTQGRSRYDWSDRQWVRWPSTQGDVIAPARRPGSNGRGPYPREEAPQ